LYRIQEKESTELSFQFYNCMLCIRFKCLKKEIAMNRKCTRLLAASAVVISLGLGPILDPVLAQSPPQQRPPVPDIPVKGDTTHSLSRHFTAASTVKKAPDAKGFIQRWLVLEPIKKDITRNNILTDSFVRRSVSSDNFSSDFTAVPKNGATVRMENQEQKWYALDSREFNFNLYHFTYDINKPRYGILVWLVTVIDCPEEMQNVRMAAGCNSASVWWLNGQEALALSGDRDLVVDNVTSSRLTLKKERISSVGQ